MYPGSSLLHWGLKSLRVPSAEVPWWIMNMIKVRRKNQWKLQNFNPCLFSSASPLFSSFSPFACSTQILSIFYKNLSSHPLNDSKKQTNRKKPNCSEHARHAAKAIANLRLLCVASPCVHVHLQNDRSQTTSHLKIFFTTYLFVSTWSKWEWMSFIWRRLIERAASLATTLNAVKYLFYQSSRNLALSQRRMTDKNVQAGMAAWSLFLQSHNSSSIIWLLCTIPDKRP